MSAPPPAPFTTLAEVERIAALPDPVARNLHITQSYHELAVALSRRIGGANWCVYATWASKQAGQTIRKEDLSRALRNAAFTAQSDHDVAAAARALGSTRSAEDIREAVYRAMSAQTALDRASDAVGRGNRKVFEEIGREFARFLETCCDDEVNNGQRLAGFCEALRPGEPPDGQRYLQQAFTRYYTAFFEPDPRVRAELMFLANIEIGFHEQTRLQPEIEEAMNAASPDGRWVKLAVILAIFSIRGLWVWVRLLALRLLRRRSALDVLLDRLIADVRRQMRVFVTEHMMTIGLPGDVRLRLGEDVPGEFPPLLREITMPELRELLRGIDPTPDDMHGSGADDWSHLPDRLQFIAHMFRRYHDWTALFDPPFTPGQLAAVKAGQRPDGEL